MRKLAFRLATILSLAALASCQTDRLRRVDEAREGMDKAQVLDAIGGPDRAERSHGQDRWFYVDKKDGAAREVRFEEGKAIYVGPVVQPRVSADEQDRMNAEADERADAAERKAIEADRAAQAERAAKIRREEPEPPSKAQRFEPIQ